MRRAFAAVLAATLFAATGGPASALGSETVETTARASILAAIVDAQPAFDPALVDSRGAHSTIGTSSLNSVVWPSFLVDAFFFLYGFQSVERVGLGVSEARWPQGPQTERATLSDLAFANGGDASTVPGKGGRSEAGATDGRADGAASIADGALPGGVTIAQARSTSSIETATADAEQVVAGLIAGPLQVRAVRGDAHVDGRAKKVRSTLAVIDASVAGVPVKVDDEGARAATEPLQEQVDAALRDSGVTVRLLPATRSVEGSTSTASSGGLLVQVRVKADDPTGTPRDVKLAYLFGSAGAQARRDVNASTPVVDGDIDVTFSTPVFRNVPVSLTPDVPGAAAPGPLVRRRLVITAASGGLAANARGAYGALLLFAIGALLTRPLVRAAARP